MAKTPTTRTLEWLGEHGWTADVVERRVTRSVSKDFLGIADIIAIRQGETVAVQATSASNVAARVRKVEEAPELRTIREAGWQIWVVGWRRDREEPRVEDLT